MAINPLWGGVLGSATDVLGNVIQNRENRKLANQAQQFELEMWNRSNDYNSPAAQMSRLKQAGLNPNLVYGSGNVSGQTSSQAPKAHIPEYKSPIGANLGFNILNSIMMVLDKNADIQKKIQDTQNAKQTFDFLEETWLPRSAKLAQEAYKSEADAQTKWQLFKSGKLYDYQSSLMDLGIKRMMNLFDIEKNKKTISDYDTALQEALFTFKKTNPYLGMILETLGSFSGLNLMSRTPFGKAPSSERKVIYKKF